MRNKIIASLVAGGLLVGAGFATSIVSAPDTAVAQEETGQEERGILHRGLELLGNVLDELVSEGTIDSDQADAVLQAVEVTAAEMKAEREALRDEIMGYLEDDVLTETEAANLPEDHWLLSDVFDDAWADSELTTAEIRETRPHPRRNAFKHGARFGALLDDGGIDRAEYDGLPEEHPLKQADVTEYLEDGVITFDELRELRGDLDPPFGQDT